MLILSWLFLVWLVHCTLSEETLWAIIENFATPFSSWSKSGNGMSHVTFVFEPAAISLLQNSNLPFLCGLARFENSADSNTKLLPWHSTCKLLSDFQFYLCIALSHTPMSTFPRYQQETRVSATDVHTLAKLGVLLHWACGYTSRLSSA